MLEIISENLPILLCFLFGIGLLIVEEFMPGFGIAGISGILLLIGSVVLAYTRYGWLVAGGMALLCLVVAGGSVLITVRSAKKGRLSKSALILNESETVAAGYTAIEDMEAFLGKEGVAATVLRPAGMAEFDGVRLNVVTDGEYIPEKTQVRVTKVEGARVVVQKLNQI